MKTFKKVLSILIVAVLCFSLASCSMVDDTDITKDNIKIGVVLPGQTDGDDDYVPDLATLQTLTAVNGACSIGAGLDSERFQYSENVDPADVDAVCDAIHALINRECTMLFLADEGYMAAVEKYLSGDSEDGDVSATETKVQFIVYNGKDNGKNIHSYSADISGAVYVSGVVAGLKAKELNVPKIGYLLEDGNDCALLNAFALGAQSVYSDLKIEAKVCSDVQADCHALIANGNVVIASDFYADAIAESCEDTYFCGFGSDNLSGSENFLCAPIYDYSQYYLNTIFEVVDYDDVEYDENDKEIDKSDALPNVPVYEGNYANGAVYISQYGSACAEGTKAAVDVAEAAVLDGSVSFDISATAPIAGVTLAK